MKTFYFSIYLILASFLVKAQSFERGIPPSLDNINKGFRAHEVVDKRYLPSVDKENFYKKKNEILKDSVDRRTLLVGQNIDVNLNMRNSGTIEYFNNGAKIWRLHVVSLEAKEILVLFNKFLLPQNAKLFLYDKNREQILGAFTSKNNKESGSFSAGPIKGDEFYIEYFEPKDVEFNGVLSISRIAHIIDGVQDSKLKSFGGSASCHINVMCPEGDGWCDQRRSVAKIWILTTLDPYTYVATGSLITNERRDSRPYFITAGHCVDINEDDNFSSAEMNDVQNWLFTFNYQSSTCSNPSSDPYNSSWAFNISGASWVSGNMNMDFALLELSTRPPGNFNTYYNGWDNETKLWDDGKIIHHPDGDIKKITYWTKKTQLTPNFFRRFKIEKGGIEGGTSGAPAFINNGYLVGVHSGSKSGSDACDKDAWREYGRFCKMWDHGSNSSLRVREKLNPNGDFSGGYQYYITSMSGDEPCKENYYFNNAEDLHTSANVNFNNPSTIGTRTYNGVYEATNEITAENVTIKSGTSVTFNAGNSISLLPGFKVEAGATFHAYIDGCERGCGNGFKSAKINDDITDMSIFKGYIDSLVIQAELSENIDLLNVDLSDDIRVFPNPTNDILNIEIINIENVYSIELINSLGGHIVHRKIENDKYVKMNISNFKEGIYFLKINMTDKIVIRKVIKN